MALVAGQFTRAVDADTIESRTDQQVKDQLAITGGAQVFISAQTANNDAMIDFTLTSTYSAATLGLKGNSGGMEFNSAGTILYIIDRVVPPLFSEVCPQLNGNVPTLSTRGGKLVGGSPITITMSKAPAFQAVSNLILGVGSSGNAGGITLIGSCRVHVNPLISIPFPTAVVATFAFTVPTAAKGLTLFAQGWTLSQGANALNVTVSDSAVCLIK